MSPITLGEMDAIRLMNRVDTKFVATEDQLVSFLRAAQPLYRAFETEAGRINSYDTVYWDTPDREMYLAHHNRRLNRKKVRVRTYVESGQTFLEIKLKNNHGRTKKKRLPCDATAPFGVEQSSFLEERSGYVPSELVPCLRTAFDRITLVNNAKTERLTIDLKLRFDNLANGTSGTLGNIVIIELKQDGLQKSDAREILQTLRIHPFKVSKYCIGTAMTDTTVKQGRFKSKILTLKKLSNK